MKQIAYVAGVVALMLLSACGNVNESVEKMIPSDATGVVSIDVPAILKKAQMSDDGRIVVPADLSEVIDANDAAPLCQALTDLPVLGINTEAKAYAYFSDGTFASALLVPLSDEAAARKTIAARVGAEFTELDQLSCLANRDNFFAVHDGVLLAARVGKAAEAEKLAKAARTLYDRKGHSILEVDQAKDCLDAKGDINAWFKMAGLKALLKRNKSYREAAQRLPLIEVFTESDIDAVTCSINLTEQDAQVTTKFLVADGSDYLKLMNTIIAQPDAAVLNVIPSSMDYVLAMSVKGGQLVQLPQIEQLLALFGKLPHIGRLDLKGMLSTIDGPVAVALAPDPYLQGEWNAVIAARSTQPGNALQTISSFAQSMGQAPELYGNEYVYQYENKMIKVGMNGQVIYLTMLNYEATESNAAADDALSSLFASTPLSLAVKTHVGQSQGRFTFGLTDHVNGHGTYVPAEGEASPTRALLKTLCAIRPAAAYDDMIDPGEDSSDNDFLPEGVKLHPVR
ncbi:MAG: DUF4836 family protein [Muribaculaceae bacterium]|nr:DUF4836 family protein [Muribaculaceae bacterium]